MALNNYTTISAAVGTWIRRSGFAVITANVEDLMYLGQRRMERDIRVPPMEVLASNITITDGQWPIPGAFLDAKEIVAYDGYSSWPVYRKSYRDVKDARVRGDTGPSCFVPVAGNLEFGAAPNGGVSVDVVYYQELEYISTTVAQNWFSAYAPEMILWSSLVEAAVLLNDDDKEAKFERRYQASWALLDKQKRRAEYAGELRLRAI